MIAGWNVDIDSSAPLIAGTLFIVLFLLHLPRFFSSKKAPLFLRLLGIISLLLALLSPTVYREQREEIPLLLVDVSKSMEIEQANQLLSTARKIHSTLKIVPFAGDTGVQIPDTQFNFQELQQGWQTLDEGSTNLESALAQVQGSILLLSDGFLTRGETNPEVLAQRGGKIFPLLPESNLSYETPGVSFLEVPLLVAQGGAAPIAASLKNPSNKPVGGTFKFLHDGKEVFVQKLSLQPHSEERVTAFSDPALDGLRKIEARFIPDASDIPPSSKTAYLSSKKKERILLLSGTKEEATNVENVLAQEKIPVESYIGPESAPILVDRLNTFSRIILNNINASTLSTRGVALLERFVSEGGSLLMLGGNQSFGLGKYQGTPLEKALPVELIEPRTEQKRLNVAVSLVIDKSRSMADDQRLEYAKSAAKEVVQNLKDDDFIEVIGFDSTPFVVLRISKVAEVRSQALDRIDRLFSAGKTNLLPALDEARKSLERVPAGRKHTIVLTDGRLPDAGPHYIQLIKQMRLSGITTSTILLGYEGFDELLNQMAGTGGGNFYHTTDPRSLPRIFLQDVKVAGEEKTLQESQEYIVRRGSGILSTTSIQAFPPLKGFVETKEKKSANTELLITGGNKSSPLLASWKYGRGKVVAFTSDVTGRWSALWVRWERFSTFVHDLLRSITLDQQKKEEEDRFDLRSSITGNTLHLELAIFHEDEGTEIPAEISSLSSGKNTTILFQREAPGRYTAECPSITTGTYVAKIQGRKHQYVPVALELPPELFGERRGLGFNREFLTMLAQRSGGKVNPSPQDLITTTSARGQQHHLAEPLLGFALLLLLIERMLMGGRRNKE